MQRRGTVRAVFARCVRLSCYDRDRWIAVSFSLSNLVQRSASPPATRLVSLSLRFLQRLVSAPFALPMYVWLFVRSCVQVQHTHTPTVFAPNASTLAHVSRCAIAWGALKLRVPRRLRKNKHANMYQTRVVLYSLHAGFASWKL